MYCFFNVGEDGGVVLFFGLFGIGKIILFVDFDCYLIGDDEYGWVKGVVFNLEGGCYVKCIDLSQKNELVIWDVICFGVVLENVVMDDNCILDYEDCLLIQNICVVYLLENIEKWVIENSVGEFKYVIFLICDLNGVIFLVFCFNN